MGKKPDGKKNQGDKANAPKARKTKQYQEGPKKIPLSESTKRRTRHLMLFTRLDTQEDLQRLMADPALIGYSAFDIRKEREQHFGRYIGPLADDKTATKEAA